LRARIVLAALGPPGFHGYRLNALRDNPVLNALSDGESLAARHQFANVYALTSDTVKFLATRGLIDHSFIATPAIRVAGVVRTDIAVVTIEVTARNATALVTAIAIGASIPIITGHRIVGIGTT
jgi:hypothetical protein